LTFAQVNQNQRRVGLVSVELPGVSVPRTSIMRAKAVTMRGHGRVTFAFLRHRSMSLRIDRESLPFRNRHAQRGQSSMPTALTVVSNRAASQFRLATKSIAIQLADSLTRSNQRSQRVSDGLRASHGLEAAAFVTASGVRSP
jgi:hypothetical protein